MNLPLFGIQCLNLYTLTFLLFLGHAAFINQAPEDNFDFCVT